MVRGVGVEPTSLAASGPKPGAFANSASRATCCNSFHNLHCFYKKTISMAYFYAYLQQITGQMY